MADIADIANDRAEMELERALASRQQYFIGAESANECIDCGELIPSERQVAVPGCQLCVSCAELAELKGR